jgi:hypothetical protein
LVVVLVRHELANINTAFKLSDFETLTSSVFNEITETAWCSYVKYTENLKENFRNEQLLYSIMDLDKVQDSNTSARNSGSCDEVIATSLRRNYTHIEENFSSNFIFSYTYEPLIASVV